MPSLALVPDDSLELESVLKQLIDSLLSHLAREIMLYEELGRIVHREREILRRPSPAVILAGNESKEAWILKARALEEDRMKIIKKIAAFFGRKEQEITISFLIPHLEEDQREMMRSRRKLLFALIAEVKKTNEANRDVLDYSLARVKDSLNFINDLRGMKSGYSSSGKAGTGAGNGIMFSQEA